MKGWTENVEGYKYQVLISSFDDSQDVMPAIFRSILIP